MGLVPASLPHTLGYACIFYAPTSPPPKPHMQKAPPPELWRMSGNFPATLVNVSRERKLNTNFFFSNFLGTSGISQQNPGISRQKSLISLVSRGTPNFLAPTPSCGKPLPHRKISGLKSLGLCSFSCPSQGGSHEYGNVDSPKVRRTSPKFA